MMSIVFSRNKEKRPRSSSSDANNSFVKNVTSRVSSLLPATITKWFSSPSSSNTNGSTPAADNTDSSTEDESPESPISTQPPAKRMRYSSPGKYNNFTLTDTTSTLRTTETKDLPLTSYNAVQSPPGRNTFSRDTNFVSTPIRSPDDEPAMEISDRETTDYKTQHSVSTIGQSLSSKRKSLFESSSKRESNKTSKPSITISDPKKPCFKPTLLGSPFYSGRTMYGGAASSSYVNQPNIKQRKVAFVKESNANDTATMSQSARRIMDLLENYSSPLSEARRIPQLVKIPKNDSLNASTDSISTYGNKVLSYKTQELHVPSIASILRLKQRSRLMDTTNAARQIIASHSSSDYTPYPTTSSSTYNAHRDQDDTDSCTNLTTKVKSRLTRAKRGGDSIIDEAPAPVQLPKAVLQIDHGNLPKFSFGSSSSAKVTNSTSFFSMVTSVSTVTSSAPIFSVSESSLRSKLEPVLNKSDDASSLFRFSSPVPVVCESSANSTPPKFIFGSPERGVDKPVGDKKDDSSDAVGPIKATKTTDERPKDWKCPECWISNKHDDAKCVCCGFKRISPTGKPAKCSVCKLADSQSKSDKCDNCDKIKANNTDAVTVVKPSDSSKWTCEECWVSNDVSADKCPCCGNPKLKKVSSNAVEQSGTRSIASDWKCDDCWITNKSTVDKCAACGSVKPGSKSSHVPLSGTATSIPVKSSDNIFNNITKSQNIDKWECSSCLVRNDKDKTICACCGTEKQSMQGTGMKSFNFGVNTNTTFKFGINHKAQEASLTKKNEEVAPIAKPKAEESETNNNILATTPTFTFALRPKKPEEVNDTTEPKTDAPPKMNFTFGMAKLTPATPVAVNKSTDRVNDTEEKPQEVPEVKVAPQVQETQKPFTGLFEAVAPDASKPATAVPSMMCSTFATETKDNTHVKQLVQATPSATSAETSPPQTTFSFSPSGMGAGVNLFGGPVLTTTAIKINFGSPSQTTSAPTTAPAMTLFQKPETTASPINLFPISDPKPTSTVSLFQKTEASNVSALPSVAATAPVFGFGSNPAPHQDKPKFNFTFGSTNNKPESTMFKSFGTLGDATAVSKAFTVSSASGLSHAGTLGGTNGPRAGTPIMSNLGGATELSTGPLARGSLQIGNMSGGMFGQKDNNMWSSNNNSSSSSAAPSLFVSTASTNSLQKPAAFTFGSSTAFNATTTTPPAFGSSPQPAQNVFGMSGQGGGSQPQPPLFSSGSIFGKAKPAPSPAPAMGMFGTPNVGAAPSFGAPSSSIPSFEAPSLTPAPAPAFNFGAPQTTAVFGFGQQPQQQQPQQQQQQQQQTGIYNFGGPNASPQVQFNMGSAPAMRRVRKAVRRNPPR